MSDEYQRLKLVVHSVAGMDMDRAISVARVFDAHPDLRPRKAGGDPPRIAVEPSLESVVAQHGLPIDWLTFREMKPEMEMGVISLFPGRGGAFAEVIAGKYEGELRGNWIEQAWASKTLNSPKFVQELEQLFEELVVALDGTWGAVDLNVRRGPAVWKQLPGSSGETTSARPSSRDTRHYARCLGRSCSPTAELSCPAEPSSARTEPDRPYPIH